jgi:bacterioferritin-associated ferredoxin
LSPLRSKGLALVREVKKHVRIVKNVTSLRADGESTIKRVTFATHSGGEDHIDVDALLLHQGVVPNTNLAMSAGVAHRWDRAQLCWAPVLDDFGGSNLSGIAVAGDGGGIAGASAAEELGRMTALSVIRSLRPEAATEDEQTVRQRLMRHRIGRRFLDTLYQPPKQFRVPADETIVCRCEEVSAGQIRAAARLGCVGPNQVKAFLRTGMGPCQGRLCGLTVTEILADSHGRSPMGIGHFRIRSPVKPITLSEMAGIPADEPAIKAVVRL